MKWLHLYEIAVGNSGYSRKKKQRKRAKRLRRQSIIIINDVLLPQEVLKKLLNSNPESPEAIIERARQLVPIRPIELPMTIGDSNASLEITR